ncbi:ATP synthase F1 subunit gamma [Marinilabiliaceae bacterium ANBcel2]|nr:ATP synthase F1 subunit gamma [Marinilabiliaceae bacterium ANBcel2]
MANLRDIKTRINSVKTTRQVTSAMKMVSAARLKKSQDDISHIRPYTSRLAAIIQNLMSAIDDNVEVDYSRPVAESKKILIIAIASNRGLCGAFNINIVKEVQSLLRNKFRDEKKSDNVLLGVMGQQAEKMFKSRNINIDFTYHSYLNRPLYESIARLAAEFMRDFNAGGIKQVVLVYNGFVNAAVQEVQVQQYLPFYVPDAEPQTEWCSDYILEPDPCYIVQTLIPKMLQSMFYQVVLESVASEHGARMTSMHKATDNATDLIRELQLGYNKARQTAITNQIVEITGGAEALKK